ncbi:MAG: septum formation initiator family protein [Lachnospiraceae bacterium]|jgi:cell division protein FtsB|nr:septum formation initiator family protein [Lachnospiraceae bacterium]
MSRRDARTRINNKKRITKREKLRCYILVAVFVVAVGVCGFRTVSKCQKYDAQISSYKAQLKNENKKEKENKELAKRVKTDEFVEQYAREKLHMAFDNEVVIKKSN